MTSTSTWESSEYPLLCSSCLGPNPYTRMTREKFGTDCKVCLKPYTTFRWRPSNSSRYRQTVICQTCSKLKGVCQGCILDINYQIPVANRDSVLKVSENPPKQEANREYYLATNFSRLQKQDNTLIEHSSLISDADKVQLEKLSKSFKKTHDANEKLPCSFYAKGKCTRGDSCPYSHALKVSKPPTLKSYRDKYYGTEDFFVEPAAADASKSSLVDNSVHQEGEKNPQESKVLPSSNSFGSFL